MGMNQTKVTFKTFLAWKKRKRVEKMEAGISAKAKREADFKQGRTAGISGREMFEFNPNLVTESGEVDEDGEGDVVYARTTEAEEDEYTGPLREIDANTFLLTEEDADDDETIVNGEHQTLLMSASAIPGLSKSLKNDKDPGLIAVDEELFDEADLDDLENELDELEIEQ
ncbi:unnamed protein product [Echinostoma caproni]|uniref:ZC3H15/TMA46 family C-terminal domain-containing protein n=1 Tax=Echinostoma caproni TaxID=27848 RepID=A0A3P8KA22_9TREM|nr:unnamed protein product [Echinostoma caproni]